METEETTEKIIGNMKYGPIPHHHTDIELLNGFAKRLEESRKREHYEICQMLRNVIGGICQHCDLHEACAEGEDGMPTTCNAVAIARHWIEEHEPQKSNPSDEMPF